MIYEDFQLLASDVGIYEKDGENYVKFQVRVLQSPAGDPLENFPSQYNLSEMRIRLQTLKTHDWGAVIDLGEWLCSLLFPPGLRELLDSSLKIVKTHGKSLRIRLNLNGQLHTIPWEYILLNMGGGESVKTDFLALMPDISITRHQSVALPSSELKLFKTARMLAAFADSDEDKPLSLEDEQRVIMQALQGNSRIRPDSITNPTRETLSESLESIHIFHFSGHGKFLVTDTDETGAKSIKSFIILDDRSGKEKYLNADDLALLLRRAGVRVAVLAACFSGHRDDFNVWSSVATALLKADVGAVVGMQHSISDQGAAKFTHTFYRALATGLSIDEAVTKGRIAAAQVNPRDWGVPVLYLRAADGVIFPEFAAETNSDHSRKQEQAIELNRKNKPLNHYKGDNISAIGLDAPAVEDTGIEVDFSSLLIERRVQQEIIDDILRIGQQVRWFAAVGESGTGKSCLLRLLGEATGAQWFLRAHSLLESGDPFQKDKAQVYDHFIKNAEAFLRDFEAKPGNDSQSQRVFVFIDTLDLIINEIGESALRDFLLRILSYPNTFLITTCRPREFKVLAKPLKKYKEPDSSSPHRDERYKSDYHTYRIDDFDDIELPLVLEKYIDAFYKDWETEQKKELSKRMGALRTESREINHICRHPLSLRLLFEVYAREVIPENIKLRDLYTLFWNKKVRTSSHQTARFRECYVMQAALWMFELGSDQVYEEKVNEFFYKNQDAPDVSRIRGILRSENIFRHKSSHKSCDWLGAGTQASQLEFFHQSFLEYSTARTLLRSECDFLPTIIEYVKKVPNDSMRLEVLRQVAYLDEKSARKILPELLAADSVFLKKTAIDIYIKLDVSNAKTFNSQIEELLTKSIHLHKTNPNVLLLYFLDNLHNMPENRFPELFHLGNGFFKKVLIDTTFPQIIEHLFEAIARIMIFKCPIAASWLKWSIHEWKFSEKESYTFYPRCVIPPLLNWAQWDSEDCMPILWYVFTRHAGEKNKKWILDCWPQLSAELGDQYKEKLLQFLEGNARDLKRNNDLTDAYATIINKLIYDENERDALINRLEQIIINDARKYSRAIAVQLLTKLLPANQRETWGKRILQPGTFPDELRMFLLGNLMRRWLEEGDDTIKNMLWESFRKENQSSMLFTRLLDLWGRYDGELPNKDNLNDVYHFVSRKEDTSIRHKQYALFIMAKSLNEDAPGKQEDFFNLVEELPRKSWRSLFDMIPSSDAFRPVVLEKIQYYATRKEGHIKRAALWLILGRPWDDFIFSTEIARAFEHLTETSDAEVLELTLKAILNESSLIERLPSSYLLNLGFRCFIRKENYMNALALQLLSYGVTLNRWSLSSREWLQIWQAIEANNNPNASRYLWKLVQSAITSKDGNFPGTWSWRIANSYLDKWLENDDMQKPLQEALIAVAEWGVNHPGEASDILLKYSDRPLKDTGRYKWIGAMLRIITSQRVTSEAKMQIISKILKSLEQSNPDRQILLIDIIARLPEKILEKNENWKGYGYLLAEQFICDRAKEILQDHVGRLLEVPPLKSSFFANIRTNICS